MLRWKSRNLVGLDIGSSSIKAVELRQAGGACSLASFGVAPLPAGVIGDGLISDPEAVAGVLRELLDEQGFGARSVALALGGNAVRLRRVELPAMPPGELEAAVHWEARQHVPFPPEEMTLEYQVLSPPPGAPPDRPLDVLLVAARKDRVAAYTEVVERAGCTATVIDIEPCALVNAWALNYDVDDAAALALLDLGASTARLTVAAGSRPAGMRVLPLGARSYVEALCGQLGLDADEAQKLLRAACANEPLPAPVVAALGAVHEGLADEVSGTLEYFRRTVLPEPLAALALCGGAARVTGLVDILAERQQTPVELFDPFRRVVGVDARCQQDGPRAAVAVGLALRQAGER